LWASFGDWKWTKVNDVEFASEYGKILKGIWAVKMHTKGFHAKLMLADELYAQALCTLNKQ
jgi:hypothetical protein